MTKQEKQRYCSGCRENYYNHSGHSTTGECWLLKSARVVTRWRLGWWTAPTVPGAFTECKTLNCWNSDSGPGNVAMYETLPSFAVDPHRLERKQ